jgi:hypothetical protein
VQTDRKQINRAGSGKPLYMLIRGDRLDPVTKT